MKKLSAFAVAVALGLAFASTASAASMSADQITAILKAAGVNDATIAVIVAGLGNTAPAASTAQFTVNLGVGSTGADVTALQNVLIAKGYLKIAAPTGTFGPLTKAAVSAWQAASGIPATGFVGPLSRNALNGMSGTPTTPAPATGTPTTPGSVVSDGTDGSVTVAVSPYVSRSQTLKKGDTKDIIAVNLKGTSGAVTVNRFDVHFSTKPWLVFNQLTLKDSSGKVLATKTITSSADVTEVTTNSDYLVRFDNVNYSVMPTGSDTILIVGATVLSSSDKITGQAVDVQVPTGSIRTVNGRGYTDSLGLGTAFDSNKNTVTLSTSGSVADLNTRIDPSTPDTRTQTISSSGNTTSDVTLGIFGVKTQNQASTINSLSIDINTSRESQNFDATTMFQNVRLTDGTNTYGATSVSSAGVAAFSNMKIALGQDQWKTLKVMADVTASSSSYVASSTLLKATVAGSDANDNTITLTNASNVTANNVTFVPNGGITISNLVKKLRSNTLSTTAGNWTTAYPTLGFTVTNNGNLPIYLSKNANLALATTTSSGLTSSTTVTQVTAGGSTTGDSSTSYYVNAGASRDFTFDFTTSNINGSADASKILAITQINYGTTDGAVDLNINFGLETLKQTTP